ncbi:hypothetical protein PIB30_081734 [Stylosanthes scabra]|uniref:Uncharacterized protein n=1 Tax=Stylosanthes scabra TaxID=79078 RepID=A0ABU6TRC1_9FABA|nr:hypothetical protein [Stylosanthes scabra]
MQVSVIGTQATVCEFCGGAHKIEECEQVQQPAEQNNFNAPNQPQAPPIPPQDNPKPSSLEIAMDKLTQSTSAFVQHTSSFMQQTRSCMDETRANFKNQDASIKNLEVQVEQIAKQLAKPTNTFPSDTELNPREECKAIYLRSGKVVNKETTQCDNKNEEVAEKEQEKEDTHALIKANKEKEAVKAYGPRIPFPQRLKEHNN